MFAGRLLKKGYLIKRFSLQGGKGTEHRLPCIFHGKDGILVSLTEGRGRILVKRFDKRGFRDYKALRIPQKKGIFIRRIHIREGPSGVEVSFLEGTKGHIYGIEREKRFFIAGSVNLVPIRDLKEVDEKISSQREGVSDGRWNGILSPSEGKGEVI